MKYSGFLPGVLGLIFAGLLIGCGEVKDTGTAPYHSPLSLSSTKSPIIHVTDWSSISSGFQYTCAIDTNYSYPWCWGNNSYGELGSGDTKNYLTPHLVLFAGTDTWAQISAGGDYFTCARKTNGTLWCWGWNFDGQLGDGTTANRLFPVQVGIATNWVSVDVGEDHACGLHDDHTLWCWGRNDYGEIGNGGGGNANTGPVLLAKSWKTVSAGGFHTCAIKTDSSLWCWGYNEYGQLGIGNTIDKYVPAKVGTDTNWASVSAGFQHTCAIKKDGTLWCWGANARGQVGNGKDSNDVKKPVQVGKANTWKSLSLGANHSCAMKKNTGLYCWGWNVTGQLGMGNTTDLNRPHIVAHGGTGYLSVSAGYGHTCGLWKDDQIYCWGDNIYGELGEGDTVNTDYPENTVVNP